MPLLHLLPGAGVPVFQVSMPVTLDSAAALRLGRALAPLRDRGVAIVASGSLTHNLYEFRQSARGEAAYARQFADWVRAQVLAGDRDRLRDYRRDAPHAERAHPTEEHFLPLLVASGAAMADEPAQVIEGGITHGVLAMDAFAGACLRLNRRSGRHARRRQPGSPRCRWPHEPSASPTGTAAGGPGI